MKRAVLGLAVLLVGRTCLGVGPGHVASWGLDGQGQMGGTPAGTDFVAFVAGWSHSLLEEQST